MPVMGGGDVQIGEQNRAAMWRSLDSAPTLLENYLWGCLLGVTSWEIYLEELSITSLDGPGHVPDDFAGVP